MENRKLTMFNTRVLDIINCVQVVYVICGIAVEFEIRLVFDFSISLSCNNKKKKTFHFISIESSDRTLLNLWCSIEILKTAHLEVGLYDLFKNYSCSCKFHKITSLRWLLFENIVITSIGNQLKNCFIILFEILLLRFTGHFVH